MTRPLAPLVFALAMLTFGQPESEQLAAAEAPASALSATAGTGLAQDDPYAEVAARLTRFIESERRSKDLPAVSIALVDGDRRVWSAGFGPADAEGKSQATGATVYRVGSVSKLFTDMAVMQLASQGQVDVDADIRQYLPDFQPENPYGKPITLRQLMSHQSGLVREPPVGNYFDPDEPSLEATVLSLNQTKLVYEPQTQTKYSNAAVSVAGLVVERVSGQTFAEYAQQKLLAPLAMESSAFLRNPKIDALVPPAWMRSHHRRRVEAPRFFLGTLPAGNLYSSMDDQANFLIAVLGGGSFQGRQVLTQDLLQSMLEPRKAASDAAPSYGIGFRLGELDGRRTFGHGGAVYGFATQVVGLPDEKLGVAGVCALDCANGFVKRMTDYAVRLMLAHKAGKPLPDIESSRPIDPALALELDGLYAAGDEQMAMYEYGGKLHVEHGDTIREVRQGDGGLVLDDLEGFGPPLEISDDRRGVTLAGKTWQRLPDECPPPAPERWQGLIGEYGWDHNTLYIYEKRGRLWALIEWLYDYPLTEKSANVFEFPAAGGLYHGEQIIFTREGAGRATEATAASVVFQRRPAGDFDGAVFKVQPVRPVETLRQQALAAAPPVEPRPKRQPELVEINSLDSSIRYDVRYAGPRNFMGVPFYESAHAFLQRPAAEALARAQAALKEQGYGLLVYDAYRPWFVTKMFWDGVPAELHDFVANPAEGSRHNRGCAVDVTLCDLRSGEPVGMVAEYDEFAERSYPLYPGGDSRQRWLRRLLRRTLQREGFTVYEFEWWHFDYNNWRDYPILNLRFEELATPAAAEAGR